MDRPVHLLKQNLVSTAVALGVVIGVVASIVVSVSGNSQPAPTRHAALVSSVHKTPQVISYQGQNGVDALTLLKKHAKVQTKHYSFGDLVTSINGQAGNGPKYWTFYINGKEASVGAGSYITKNSDKLEWKLQ